MTDQTRRALLAGSATGVFSGLTGVGGGALAVSIMVSWLGMDQHIAQGTSPALILPAAFFGAITYIIQGMNGQFPFDLSLALRLVPALAIPSLFGVVIGGTWMSALPREHLRRAFGVFLFFVALSMLGRGILPIGAAEGTQTAVPFIFWIMLGFVTGVFSGFLGIGGAMVMIPFMTLGAGIPQHMTQGITLSVVTITTIAGALTQYRLGNVDTRAALLMAPGAIVLAIGSSIVAGMLDAFWLTKICGAVLAYFSYQFTFVSGTKGPSAPAATTASGKAGPDPTAGFYNI